MNNYRNKRLLILGNGFDVDLGMKSRYSDFAKSKVWQEKIENNALMLSRNGLLRALVDAKDKEAWFDIESSMMHYIRKQEEQHKAYGYQLASTDREEYQVICSALKEYLCEATNKLDVIYKRYEGFILLVRAYQQDLGNEVEN